MDPKLAVDSERQNPKLGRIRIYPFKSLAPIEVTECLLTESGSLENDRRFAFRLPDGTYFNAKRDPRIHEITLRANKNLSCFEFSRRGGSERMTVDPTRGFDGLEQWIFEQFNVLVKVSESKTPGFPDDTSSPGPTIISKATLERIAIWFPGLTVDSIRSRLRTNLEIENVPAFWEDHLFGENSTEGVDFTVGEAPLQGVNPCQRCIVPTRDPQTAKVLTDFAKNFRTHRKSELPPWASRSPFNHFYRVATNTRLARRMTGSIRIRVGDCVSL